MITLEMGDIVKNHKINNVIVHHFLSIDFISKVACSEAEVSQGEFALFLSKIDEFFRCRNAG